MKEKLLKILPYSGYVLFLSLGLFVFFLGAFLVVVVRTKEEQKITMPDLLGKTYIEVHNELQRKQIKVKLEEIRIPELPDGIILAQSMDPGRTMEAGSKVYLTVNSGVDRIVVPEVRGQNLVQAKSILEKVLAGETYVSLSIGGIIFVPPLGEEPPGTVIDQIPHPGKKTTTREKIFLLVTEEARTKDQSRMEPDSKSLQSQPFPFVAEYFQRNRIPFRLVTVLKPEHREFSGLVSKLQKQPTTWTADAFFLQPEENLKAGYQLLEREIKDEDNYSLVLRHRDPNTADVTQRELMSGERFQQGEAFHFLVYHKENLAEVELVGKSSGEAKTWKWKGTY